MKKGQERIYQTKGFTLYHQNRPKRSLENHFHRESHLVIPLQGTVEMEIDGILHQVKAGQMLFVGAEVEHNFSATSELGERLIFQIDLGKKDTLKNRACLLPIHQLLKNLGMDLFIYSGEKFSSSIESLIKSILLSLLDQSNSTTFDLFQVDARLLKSSNPQLKKIIKLLKNDLEADLTKISSAGALSPRSLSRLIKAEVGLTPNELLTYFRIQKALEMIYANEHNLTAIAFECGYSSLSQFIENFKKWLGTKPSAYKV